MKDLIKNMIDLFISILSFVSIVSTEDKRIRLLCTIIILLIAIKKTIIERVVKDNGKGRS